MVMSIALFSRFQSSEYQSVVIINISVLLQMEFYGLIDFLFRFLPSRALINFTIVGTVSIGIWYSNIGYTISTFRITLLSNLN